jgi:YbgC/YbaW family acyl-CoA thioester hydrolase
MYIYNETVEFEDVDSYGIAHHTKIIAYLERARVHFFLENGFNINAFGFGLVLTKLTGEFKIPLLMMDKIDIRVTISKLEKYRFAWEYEIYKENKLCIKAEIEQVMIDIATKKLTPIPDEVKKLFSTILKPA